MPLDLSLIRGGGLDLSSVASSIASANQAASAAAGISAGAYSDASRMLAQGFQLAQERKQRELAAEQERKFAREQQAAGFAENAASQKRAQEFQAESDRLTRASRAQEFETSLREGRLQAVQEMRRSLGQAAIGAGAQPGPLMELLLQAQDDTFQSNPPQLPGVPGGFMQEGFQKLMPERGRLGNIPMIPPPPSEGDRRRQDDDEVSAVKRDLEQFILSPEGQKAFLPQKVTRIEAHGWEHLDPKELERQVLGEYPSYAPTLGMDGKEALDSLMKWLKEPQEVQVMTGASVAQMRNSLWGRYSPRAIDQALTDRLGKVTATSQAEIKQIARAKLLEEMQAQKGVGSRASVGVQAPSLSALVSGAQDQQEEAQLGSGGGGPMELSKSALESMGFNPENLGRSMQSAMSLDGYQLKLDPTGRVVVQSRVGFPVDPRLQGEVDAQFNDPAREGYQRIRAAIETDPALKKSPSETKNSGTKRGLKTKTSYVPPPDANSTAPSTPASSAFARLRAERMAEKAAPKQSRRTAVPPDLSLIGRSFMPSANPLFSLSGARR